MCSQRPGPGLTQALLSPKTPRGMGGTGRVLAQRRPVLLLKPRNGNNFRSFLPYLQAPKVTPVKKGLNRSLGSTGSPSVFLLKRRAVDRLGSRRLWLCRGRAGSGLKNLHGAGLGVVTKTYRYSEDCCGRNATRCSATPHRSGLELSSGTAQPLWECLARGAWAETHY